MENHEAIRLIDKYLDGTATPEEKALLESFLITRMDGQADGASASFLNRARLQDYRTIMERTGLQDASTHTGGGLLRRIRVPMAAAIVLAAIGLGVWLTHRPDEPLAAPSEIAANVLDDDVAPGTNKATLTLPTGEVIVLDSARSGITVDDRDIRYTDGDRLITGTQKYRSQLALLQVPRGGMYRVTLPDGTRVWLNAESTLSYPIRFTGDSRTVHLEGEGFFEVSANARKPFIVKSKGQEVQVLGTRFNISSYRTEPTKTTLVSGAVRVTGTPQAADAGGGALVLKPGEQSERLPSGKLSVTKTDPAVATAWKDGNFHFSNTGFDDLMKQIARWYDIEVVYSAGVPEDSFSGQMARSGSLRTVLRLLDASEIGFRIEGRKLIIQ